jgi:hypothetical protein
LFVPEEEPDYFGTFGALGGMNASQRSRTRMGASIKSNQRSTMNATKKNQSKGNSMTRGLKGKKPSSTKVQNDGPKTPIEIQNQTMKLLKKIVKHNYNLLHLNLSFCGLIEKQIV